MKRTLDLRLYLVTGEGDQDEHAGRLIADAVAGGVTVVQVRAKSAGTAARAGLASRLLPQLERSGVPLIVNDDVEAARISGAGGVHVGPDDAHPADVRKVLGPEAIIGWSIHNIDQLADAEALAACDYLAASPVWMTPTKTDTTPPLGLAGVRALRASMPEHLPLVGIGGISEQNAAEVIRAGADGVCVVSAIWSAPDPRAAARRLRESVDAALAERTGVEPKVWGGAP
jgi:thiamine-phosphate pyrophosphorylase